MTFNPEDRRWKCMCGLTHVITGAIIIAILGIIFGIISIIGILLVVPFCALMLYGVKSERQGFIIPYLILGILMILGSIAVFILYVISLVMVPHTVERYYAENKQEFNQENDQYWRDNKGLVYGLSFGYAVFIVICAGISVFLHIYFWYVVFRAYKFIQEKKIAIATGTYQSNFGYGGPTATMVTYQNNPQQQAAYGQQAYPQPAYQQQAYPEQSPYYKAN